MTSLNAPALALLFIRAEYVGRKEERWKDIHLVMVFPFVLLGGVFFFFLWKQKRGCKGFGRGENCSGAMADYLRTGRLKAGEVASNEELS